MRARTLSVLTIVIGLVATATSCRKPSESASADSTFVHAMIDLRLVTVNTTLDSAAKARARDSILRHYNTSPAALESTARLLGNNPDRAVELLRMIDLGVRTGSRPAPVAPASPPPPAAPPAPAPTHK
jgi:hypothetical protein